MAKEQQGLAMDFGELLDTKGSIFNSITKPEEKTAENKQENENNNEDQLVLDINEVLSHKENTDTDESNEEVNKDKGDAPGPDVTKTNNSSSNSFALVFAKYLKDQGAISDYKEEDIEKISKDEGDEAAVSYIKDLLSGEIKGDLKKEYDSEYQEFRRLRDEGVDPNTALNLTLGEADLAKISDEDIETSDNIDLRKQLISEYYRSTGTMDDKKINKLVESHIKLGEDIEVAKEYHKELQDIYKTKKQEEIQTAKQTIVDNKKKYQENINQIKTTIQSIEEIIPGQKINKQTKQKIEDALLKPIQVDANGRQLNAIQAERAKNPTKFDSIVAYMMLTGAFEGKWDKVQSAVKTKTINELKDFFNQDDKRGVRAVTRNERDDISATEKSNLDSLRSFIKR